MENARMDDRATLVVTGSSAGGIEALLAFLPSLPADLSAAVIIAQHLDPRRPSRLPEILAQHCALPIHEVADRAPLENGHIYIAAPNHDLTVVDGAVESVAEDRVGVKPSINRLFTSGANAYKDRLIGIVFSGSGSDGVEGARAIKEHGGVVIVQDPGTAVHASMPRAVPPTVVDLSAGPEEIGKLLGELTRRSTEKSSEEDEKAVQALLMQLREHTGVDFLEYRMPTIVRRLTRLMIAAGKRSIGDYAAYVKSNPEEYQHLVAAFLINVTDFFRDAALFQALQNDVLPKLIEEAEREQRDLRIWSAGCSTGEEAYSLAILCAAIIKQTKSNVGVRIFATDLDEQALMFARRGVYGAESVRRVPADWLREYFISRDGSYEVAKQIRALVVFGQHDLVRRAPFPQIDLCLCRNVLMYFTRPLQLQVLNIFAFSLREGGYLVLGKAETTKAMERYFAVEDSSLKIYRRFGEQAHIPNLPMSQFGSTLEPVRSTKGVTPAASTKSTQPPANDVAVSIGRLPLGFLLINRQYDILFINAAARALFDIRTIGLGEDLIHRARVDRSDELRDIVDAAFRGEQTGPHSFGIADPVSGASRSVDVTCYPDPAPGNLVDRVALLVTDVTEAVAKRQSLEQRSIEEGEKVKALTQRLQVLQERQKTLIEANDELATTNAELRGAIHDLNIHAEEAAAASEEITTLNEEMAATNEQLETLNEELQATNEELNATNDELQHRSSELEALGKSYDERLAGFEARDEVLSAALGRFGPFVVLGENDDVIYSSPQIADTIAAQSGDWWNSASPFVIGGKKYALTSSDIALGHKRYRLFEFKDGSSEVGVPS